MTAQGRMAARGATTAAGAMARDDRAVEAQHSWDPGQYLLFGDERTRPLADLVARIGAASPGRVVDLGAGPGTGTALLAARWPGADVLAVDSSPDMVGRADDVPGIRTQLADLRSWQPEEPVDVMVTNAALQWVPGHLDLLPRLITHLAPGRWFAMQVPGNFDEPSHTIRRELAARAPYAAHTRDVAAPSAHDASVYLGALQDLGCEVDAWETTYLHVLTGSDPVFEWVRGTGARPTLEALPDDLRPGFEQEFRRRLRTAYPDDGHGVVLPFRRVFAVARTPRD